VATAGQAKVIARDLQPLVLGRRRQHPLEQLVVALLQIAALAQRALRLADPLCQRVADRLQLAQAEDAGTAGDGRHGSIDLEPLKALGDQRPQLPLEAADLAPQLRPRESLIAARAEWCKTISLERCRHTRTKSRSPAR